MCARCRFPCVSSCDKHMLVCLPAYPRYLVLREPGVGTHSATRGAVTRRWRLELRPRARYVASQQLQGLLRDTASCAFVLCATSHTSVTGFVGSRARRAAVPLHHPQYSTQSTKAVLLASACFQSAIGPSGTMAVNVRALQGARLSSAARGKADGFAHCTVANSKQQMQKRVKKAAFRTEPDASGVPLWVLTLWRACSPSRAPPTPCGGSALSAGSSQ